MATTQNAMAFVTESTTSSTSETEKLREVEYRILHPDQSLYCLKLPYKATGFDCLDQMCDILGIVEKDYFGLQFVDKHSKCNIWINRRLQVRKQVKIKPPYELKFAVKYFTDPDLILQHTTVEAFFKDLKFQIKRGDLRVPNHKKSIIGAAIAQVEFGDKIEPSDNGATNLTPCVAYPAFFPEPEWNTGIAHIIAKEHTKMIGLDRHAAQLYFIQEVYQLETYGMAYVDASMNGGPVIVGVGAHNIRVFTPAWMCIKKIPLYALMQVAFGANFFSFMYHTRDEERNPVERKLKIVVQNHLVAKSIFRTVTEEQVFFYQNTVSNMVLNHADDRHKKWKSFRQKVFKKKYTIKYYYDIQRTKNEAYQHAWQKLNQVGSNQANLPTASHLASVVTYVNHNREEVSPPEDDNNSQMKTEVFWGLSNSSSNLAKQLLPSSHLNRSNSENVFQMCTTQMQLEECQGENNTEQDTCSADATCSQKPDSQVEPLTDAQGRKLRQLLLKIQDERLCNVCMDELISSVFCPCGHYVACNKCAKKLDKCPVCRQPVGYVQYVYSKF